MTGPTGVDTTGPDCETIVGGAIGGTIGAGCGGGSGIGAAVVADIAVGACITEAGRAGTLARGMGTFGISGGRSEASSPPRRSTVLAVG